MSKELEVLEFLKEWCSVRNIDISVLEYYKYLEKALTPPTADEMCKALSERYNVDIQYLEDKKSFVYGYLLKPICYLKEDGTIYLGANYLPPHLITLIGRFYEGVIK